MNRKIISVLVPVKGFAATENAPPFSAKPTTISFGNTTSSEKPVTAFGTGLFNNLSSTPFGVKNTQPSVILGSNTPTPIPFGTQSSNSILIQKKAEPPKSDKAASPAFDANAVQIAAMATKSAAKENVHKIEVPKPVLGGIVQDKLDTVQKPTALQPILSTAAANSMLPFGTTATAKDSSTAFNASQSNEAPKSSFSTGPSLTTGLLTKPNTTNPAPVSTVVSSTNNTVQSDFSFSLDKMGITPKSWLNDNVAGSLLIQISF